MIFYGDDLDTISKIKSDGKYMRLTLVDVVLIKMRIYRASIGV